MTEQSSSSIARLSSGEKNSSSGNKSQKQTLNPLTLTEK